MKAGTYPPLRIHYDNVNPNSRPTNVKIYGGFTGNEFITAPATRDLANPANRTVIESSAGDYAIYIEASLTGKSIIDGITLSNQYNGAALKYVSHGDLIVSKCRFEYNLGGNAYMIRREGFGEMSIINSVVSDNDVVAIYEGAEGCKFINTTIANNENYWFMKVTHGTGTNEVRNSIVYNTQTRLYSPNEHPVSVANSIVADFKYFTDDGNNVSGIDIPFNGDEYDPYSCPAWQYITAKGDINHLTSYVQLGDTDLKDIIGADRFDLIAGTIDIGAYQGPQNLPSPQYMPEYKIDDYNNIDFPDAVSIYPTDIRSGETIYFEKGIDTELTVHIYNTGGTEVYSAPLISPVEELSISCPAGIYIIIVSDDTAGERISQEKIVVH